MSADRFWAKELRHLRSRESNRKGTLKGKDGTVVHRIQMMGDARHTKSDPRQRLMNELMQQKRARSGI
ncbi:MAG TPA: hypothetical protein PKK10_11645 [Woeseiaceae bacterium]|nr:hypothetical protein [Woeseiaceae bacterium]